MQEHLNDRFAALRGLLAEAPSHQHAATLQALFTGWPDDGSLTIALEYAAQHLGSYDDAPLDDDSAFSEHELLGPSNHYALLAELPRESLAWTSLQAICRDHLAWDRQHQRVCIIRRFHNHDYYVGATLRDALEAPLEHTRECAQQNPGAHILPLLDIHFDDTHGYVAMPHIFGPNLRQLMPKLRKESTPEERTILPLAIALQVLEALDAAHQCTDQVGLRRPLYHTRLVPNNVLISEDGECHVLNFGLDRAVIDSIQHSNTSQPMGYYAPEQVFGDTTSTAATDVFHMGIVLYELLAHQHPFQGKTEIHVMRKIYDGQSTPILQILPSLPPSLASVIETALAHEPEARYPSAAAMRQELQPHYDALTTEPIEAHLASFVQRTCAVEALLTRYACLLACKQRGPLSFYWSESRAEPFIEPFPPLSYDNAYSRSDSIGAREIGRGRPLGISNLFSGIWRMLRRQN